MNLNKAFILGRVTRDPESRSLPSGQPVVNFAIATNRFYTDQTGQKKEDTEFHNIVAFGKLADTIQRYLAKGSLVMIEGRIKTRNWQNQQGVKQYRTEIIAEGMQLGPRAAGGSGAGQYQKSTDASSHNQPANTQDIPIIEENAPPANFANNDAPPSSNTDEIDVKNIPF